MRYFLQAISWLTAAVSFVCFACGAYLPAIYLILLAVQFVKLWQIGEDRR